MGLRAIVSVLITDFTNKIDLLNKVSHRGNKINEAGILEIFLSMSIIFRFYRSCCYCKSYYINWYIKRLISFLKNVSFLNFYDYLLNSFVSSSILLLVVNSQCIDAKIFSNVGIGRVKFVLLKYRGPNQLSIWQLSHNCLFGLKPLRNTSCGIQKIVHYRKPTVFCMVIL